MVNFFDMVASNAIIIMSHGAIPPDNVFSHDAMLHDDVMSHENENILPKLQK